MTLLIVIFLVCFASTIHGQKLHEHMTKEEIEAVFNVKHDLVHKLDYEVVPIVHVLNNTRGKRGDRAFTPTVYIPAFDQDYTLYLEENDNVFLGSNTPLYLAKQNTLGRRINSLNKIIYDKMNYPMIGNMKMYHDLEQKAALTMHTDADNKVHMDGVIGDNLVIRSLPKRLHDEVLHKYKNDFPQSTQHVVIKTPLNQNNFNTLASVKTLIPPVTTPTSINSANLTESDLESIENFLLSIAEQTVGETVYPELLIVLEYGTFKAHGLDIEATARYIAAFWNAVDLRFRDMSNPKVRLNIAGLIIPLQPNAAPYMESNSVGSDTLLADETLKEIGNYFMTDTEIPKDSYDVVIGITIRHLQKFIPGYFENTVSGIAGLKSACQIYTGHASALIRDQGGFKGIMTAAHEIAHVLGAPHDGPKSGTDHVGPCSQDDGYLMSYNRHDEKGFHWSNCSIIAMQEFLSTYTAICLRNKPNVGTPYSKILPGRLLSRDEQCSRQYPGFVSHRKYETNCELLYCAQYINNSYKYTSKVKPPAEGTPCGEGAICLNGKCVKDPEASS